MIMSRISLIDMRDPGCICARTSSSDMAATLARISSMLSGRFFFKAALAASPEVKPTGEGERCVTCGGAGCMNVLGEFADDDRTEVCPRCHGYGKTP